MSQSSNTYTTLSEPEPISLFAAITQNLEEKGYSVQLNALSLDLTDKLWRHLHEISLKEFHRAGVGRNNDHRVNPLLRTDEIYWISGASETGREWLAWAKSLQDYINQRLFLGLFSFESHFAHYAPDAFYKKHQDAFRDESNRVLSIVVYLNSNWQLEDGGELVLYAGDNGLDKINIAPALGTVAVFLSEEFSHEVLVTNRDRYSIAGWFRLNTTTVDKVDPPR